MTAISITELHEHTDLWVRKATEQEPIVLTDKGKAVAKIVPMPVFTVKNSTPFSESDFTGMTPQEILLWIESNPLVPAGSGERWSEEVRAERQAEAARFEERNAPIQS